MYIRTFIKTIYFCAFFGMITICCGETGEKTLSKKLLELESKIQQQQKQIEELQKAESAKVPVSFLSLSPYVEGLKIKGDLSFRADQRIQRGTLKNDERQRLRQRLRLGLVWGDQAGNWTVSAGLATGGIKPDSTYDTFGEDDIFETGDIRLDYAYVKYVLGSLTTSFGQQHNPFVRTDMVWDNNVRPSGLTFQYKFSDKWSLVGGGYDVAHFGVAQANAILSAIQVVCSEKKKDSGYTIAATCYYYNDATAQNTNAFSRSSDKLVKSEEYAYNFADIYGSFDCPLTADLILKAYGEMSYNFGAEGDPGEGLLGGTLDPSENRFAYVVGTRLSRGKISLGYEWSEIESDSVFAPIKNPIFGTASGVTDVRGHSMALGYKFTKNMSFKGKINFVERWKDADDELVLYQLNLGWKF
ncbi:putative porin [Verrucomicrobiota bacterium]